MSDLLAYELMPRDTSTHNLLKSLSVFGAAFLMRPLGGVMMGFIGDRYGTKIALTLSVAMMLCPSVLIGCLPPYRVAGAFSTVALVVLRLLQGLAVGGEVVGGYIYTIQATKGHRRGYWGGACKVPCRPSPVTLHPSLPSLTRDPVACPAPSRPAATWARPRAWA
jgi:MHS family proline/betaine transporter-like MFS transporter